MTLSSIHKIDWKPAVSITVMLMAILIATGCRGEDGEMQVSEPVAVTDFDTDRLEAVIGMESAMLAGPVEIISAGGDHYAVMDRGLNKVLIFDSGGNEALAFGGSGSGPGEWDEMSGAGNLIFGENGFIVSNRGNFRFDMYDETGTYLRSVDYPGYMNYADKELMPDGMLLASTEGRDNALAVILDPDQEGAVVKRIGTPEPMTGSRRNLEEERSMLAEGLIPPAVRNEALVEPFNDGFLLMMIGLGELRYFSPDGSLEWTQQIPVEVTEPILDHVAYKNKHEARPHTVFPLNYIADLKTDGERIYLLSNASPDVPEMRQHLLIYNKEGSLAEHFRFTHTTSETVLYGLLPRDDGSILFIDPMNARILEGCL